MTLHTVRLQGVALVAAGLVLAACSGSDGGSADSSSPVPKGIAGGPSASHSASKSGKKTTSGSASRTHAASTSSAATTVHSSTSSAAGATTTHHASRSGTPTRSTSSSKPSPQPTGPTVRVTPHAGLGDTQTVTVEGWHFKPNTTLAVAECRDRGASTNLGDCNINNVLTYQPGAKVTSDASGHVGPLQITVKKTFKRVNCGTEKCLVAISEPALNPDPADEGDQYITFG
ncbi:MAG: Neocarzinostatin family [Actinomycetota bacterium]|nr:Neocarzinostatin family [Actinomycetota bacterium]